ncbi:nucleotide sugar dehydrogenase [Castellaniella ginsengisoli]|uniref:UDP-glucose 6-dehydrogenase n=1 Tax=Castellaniella ginsengisoli TaxID=546114 RepID=A0AB39EPL8_9BURK
MSRRITIAGLGYVGISNGVLLALNNQVCAFDVDPERVDMVNRRISPVVDADVTSFLAEKSLSLHATTDPGIAFAEPEYVVIATPTNYDSTTNEFDTTSIEKVIHDVLSFDGNPVIIIKSTIPVGYTEELKRKFDYKKIMFCPEFLREGRALHDNLYPSRVVVGDRSETGVEVAQLFLEGALNKDAPIIYTGSTEAEAIKLFANTYLAMRVSYFNELDTFAMRHHLDTRNIIDGVCADPRIGMHYNNPSFGYGGYCLPKDTRQLLANYENVPQNLIRAIVESNVTRKDFIASDIAAKSPGVVGVFRLVMKSGSDNFRSSSVRGLMDRLRERAIKVVIYEPLLQSSLYDGFPVIGDLGEFKMRADVIIANRRSSDLADVADKVYTRDIFCEN